MKTPLSGLALAAPLVVVLGLASASCTHSDDTQVSAGHGVARPQAAAGVATSLYPPIQKDAGDGHVHEYY
jgi:purine-cytosine permease-like protein